MPQKQIAALLTIAREDGEAARWFGMARSSRGLMPNRNTQAASMTQPTFFINAGNYADRAKFFDSALKIKESVVGAYHGIVGQGGPSDMIQALAAIAGAQNRHWAMLKEMDGRDPFVTYVPALSLQEAGKSLSKFGFGTEVGI